MNIISTDKIKEIFKLHQLEFSGIGRRLMLSSDSSRIVIPVPKFSYQLFENFKKNGNIKVSDHIVQNALFSANLNNARSRTIKGWYYLSSKEYNNSENKKDLLSLGVSLYCMICLNTEKKHAVLKDGLYLTKSNIRIDNPCGYLKNCPAGILVFKDETKIIPMTFGNDDDSFKENFGLKKVFLRLSKRM